MQIQPYFGEEVITASNVEVRVSASDRERAQRLVFLAAEVTPVIDQETFDEARQVAGQLKAMLDEIELSRKSAKTPFTAVGRTIDEVAQKVAGPVKTAQERILGMLNGYVAKLEAARKEEQRLAAEAKRMAQEKQDRELAAARALLAETERKLREAQEETERVKLREETTRRENQLLQQQLAAELEADVAELEPAEPRKGLVAGGRVDHHYDFKLISVQQVCDARCYRLLRWELDIQACRDSVKAQLEGIPEVEPSLPGIQITKRINVSVKAASRIK